MLAPLFPGPAQDGSLQPSQADGEAASAASYFHALLEQNCRLDLRFEQFTKNIGFTSIGAN